MNFEPLTNKSIAEYARLIASISQGWAVVFCEGEMLGTWRTALESAGAHWRRWGIWDKMGSYTPQITGDRPAQECEALAIAWCGEGRSRWNARGRGNIWRCNTTWRSEGIGRKDAIHPTQKPEALMGQLIRDFTRPGELICDPFTGSASTGVAALQHGRQFLGCELDEDYHRKASERLEGATSQPDLFNTEMMDAKQGKLF
jgi:DNA modification methylase